LAKGREGIVPYLMKILFTRFGTPYNFRKEVVANPQLLADATLDIGWNRLAPM